MRYIKLFTIILLVIAITGCTDKVEEDYAVVADEIAELKGISLETAKDNFYDLSLGKDNQLPAMMTTDLLESQGVFKYIDMDAGEYYIGYVVLKDDKYYDIMLDSKNEITVVEYDTLNIAETEVEYGDNIKRKEKKYSLQKDNLTKDLFVQTRNLTPGSFVDVLKQYKGKTDIEDYDNFDNPNDILSKFYNPEDGLMIDFKYVKNDGEGLRACAIEKVPEGYCLTVYDPQKDWFEIRNYKYLVCIANKDLLQYYLSDVPGDNVSDSNLNDGSVYLFAESDVTK